MLQRIRESWDVCLCVCLIVRRGHDCPPARSCVACNMIPGRSVVDGWMLGWVRSMPGQLDSKQKPHVKHDLVQRAE